MNFKTLEQKAKNNGLRRLAVAGAAEHNIISALVRAKNEHIAEPVLIGNKENIQRAAAHVDVDISGWELHEADGNEEMVLDAMKMVRDGYVDAVMKGTVDTPVMMRTGLKNGLRREGHLLCHIALLESTRLGKFVAMSDSGLIPYPTLEQRVSIIKNAVECMRAVDIEQPKVALLSSSEAVDEKIPCSVDAQKLVEMNQPGGELDGYGVLAGPMDLWSAVDEHSAKVKNIANEVVGHADILHCPDVVAGNLLAKAAWYYAGDVKMGGCVVGGTVPIILLSRASTSDDKYYSILAGMSFHQ